MRIIIFAALFSAFNVQAWNVTPMSQEIKPTQRTFQLKINNKNGQQPVALRLKVMQRDTDEFGRDELSNTNDLLVFPKRLIVAAGKQAVARVSIRKPNTSNNEKPYRVIVDQIPVKQDKNERGVKVMTRYLTSAYLLPKAGKIEDFKVDSATIKDEGVELLLSNNGNRHKVILPSSVKIGDQAIDQKFAIKNVLPGKSIKLFLPIDKRYLTPGATLSFDNTCMVCPPNESYSLGLQ